MPTDPQWLSYARRHGDEFGDAMAEEIESQDREIDALRLILTQTIVYLDARVSDKPHSRGFALLQRLNAALIRKD